MPRPPDPDFQDRQCRDKLSFPSKKHARAGIQHLLRSGLPVSDPAWLTPYRCRVCAAWHYGHTPKRLRVDPPVVHTEPQEGEPS